MENYSFDLHRILVGDLPFAFYGEIVVRTTVLFVFALIMIRTMGKRSLGHMSAFDFVIIIALGSAVGDPMFYDDVPLLYGMVVVVVVIAMERTLALLTSRSRRVEKFVDSTPTILVQSGVVDRAALHGELMSLSELYQALRNQGITQLADIEAAVLEPSGKISVRSVDGSQTVSDLWLLEATPKSPAQR